VPTKTKTKSKAAILDEPAPAPLDAPEDQESKVRRLIDVMSKKDPPFAVREEFRALLDKVPDLALLYGNLPASARNMGLTRYESLPIMEESVKARLKQIRAELVGPAPAPVESLLVDAVVLCHQDYYSFAVMYGRTTGKTLTLEDMEKWERILASKEQRYLRAVETLARVRRLLKLPSAQVNINLPGGQQVNVSGDVKP
jgi:hypothetical protein